MPTSASPRTRPCTTSRPAARPALRPASVPVATLDLLALARHGLAEAALAAASPERYAAAHLAALRAAAALLAVRSRPARRSSQRNAWVLLAQAAPELSEWAAFFAAGAGKRAAAEAGLGRSVSLREADDLARDAETFLTLVETTLGLATQPVLAQPVLAQPVLPSRAIRADDSCS